MNAIDESLKPLFEEAEEKGLWFYSIYHGLWFSPSELKESQARGGFRWGAVNWKLRNPQEHLEQLKKKAADAKEEADEVEKAMEATNNEVQR